MAHKSFDPIWQRTKQNLALMKRTLPKEIGNAGQNFFRSSFEVQGFVDGSLERWREVQRRIKGTRAYNQASDAARTQAILVGTPGGDLRRAVGDSLVTATFTMIRFRVSNDYAIYHNQGTKKIPKRQFMGKSKVFEDRVRITVIRAMGKALK